MSTPAHLRPPRMASLLEQAQSCAKVMFDAGPTMREADRWLQQMILTQEAW